jgi:hypothetical protein
MTVDCRLILEIDFGDLSSADGRFANSLLRNRLAYSLKRLSRAQMTRRRRTTMYDTSLGIRVLYDAEARLFASSAYSLADQLRGFICDGTDESLNQYLDIQALNSLTVNQVIVLVDRVTSYLLDPNVEAPKRTAVLDAIIAAIYQQLTLDLLTEIELEIESSEIDEGDTLVRESIAEASAETSAETSDPYSGALETPDPECAVIETWQFVIDQLCDRILADSDWQLESIAMDLEPTVAAGLKAGMGIDEDYFIHVEEDVSVEEAALAWSDMLERITGWRPELWRFGGGLPMPADADIPPRAVILGFESSPTLPSNEDEGFATMDRPKPVWLPDLLFEIEEAPLERSLYVDRKTGSIVSLPTDALRSVDDEDDPRSYTGDEKSLKLARKITDSDDFLLLPRPFSEDESSIMQGFCDTVSSQPDRQELLDVLRGSRHVEVFNATVARLGYADQWHRFRYALPEQFVINWLDSHAIPWTRDDPDGLPF